MAIVAEELPFVAVVNEDKLNTVCSNCFAVTSRLNQINLKKCGNCRIVRYCSKKCRNEDWKFHKDECPLIKKSGHYGTPVRIMLRFIMRVRRGDLPVAFNGRTFDDLMDHKDDIEKDADRNADMKISYRNLVRFMGDENAPTLEEFSSLYGKRAINSFGIRYHGVLNSVDNIGIALYLGLAAHNHSCRPTAEYHFNGSKIVLRAYDPNAKYSKDLTVLYIPSIETRKSRQKHLRAKYYFDCACERCADEETALLELSGRSDCCPTEGAVLPVDKKFLWYWQQPLVCTNCGKKADTTVEWINHVNQTLKEMYKLKKNILDKVHSQEDVDKLIEVLERAELNLSPYNLNLLNLTELVSDAAAKVDENTPLYTKHSLAQKNIIKKYSIGKTVDRVLCTVSTLISETLESCDNHPREIAFPQIDATCQKALDVVKETYGPEHSLCEEITYFSEHMKFHYEIIRSQRANVKDEKTAGGGDY